MICTVFISIALTVKVEKMLEISGSQSLNAYRSCRGPEEAVFGFCKHGSRDVNVRSVGEETTLKSTPHELLDISNSRCHRRLLSMQVEWQTGKIFPRIKGKQHHDEAFRKFAFELGEAEFVKLDDSQKKNIDLLIWAGCCMHKEMNAFKGGCTQYVQDGGRRMAFLAQSKCTIGTMQRLLILEQGLQLRNVQKIIHRVGQLKSQV